MTLAFHRLAPSRLNVIGRAGEISKHSQISVRSEGKLNQRKLQRSAQVGSFAFAAAFDAATQWTRQVPSMPRRVAIDLSHYKATGRCGGRARQPQMLSPASAPQDLSTRSSTYKRSH